MHVGGIPLTASLRCVWVRVCMCHGAGRRHQVLCFFSTLDSFFRLRSKTHSSREPFLLLLPSTPPSGVETTLIGSIAPNQPLSHPVNLKQSEFNSSCPSARQPERDRNRLSKRLTLNVPCSLFLYVSVSPSLSLCLYPLTSLLSFFTPSFCG